MAQLNNRLNEMDPAMGMYWRGDEQEPQNPPPIDYSEIEADEAKWRAQKQAEETKFQAQQLHLRLVHLEYQLTIAVVEFEQQTGRKVDTIYVHDRISNPFEYVGTSKQEEFFTQRPGLEEAIKDRLVKVSIDLKKEEVV